MRNIILWNILTSDRESHSVESSPRQQVEDDDEDGQHQRQEGGAATPGEGELLALEDVVERLLRLGSLLGVRLGGGGGGGGLGGGGRGRRRRRGGGGRRLLLAAHPEDQLHVVGGAPAADAPVQVVLGGGADEVVVAAGEELQPARLRAERAEGDGEEEQLVGFVADGDHPRVGVGDAARVVLLLRDVVDDVLLGVVVVLVRRVHRADDVHLVVVELRVALVQVEHVVRVVDAEDAVRRVPVDVEDLAVGGRQVEAEA